MEAKRETEDVAVPQGSGERLRDIPNVAFKMGKLTGAYTRGGLLALRGQLARVQGPVRQGAAEVLLRRVHAGN